MSCVTIDSKILNCLKKLLGSQEPYCYMNLISKLFGLVDFQQQCILPLEMGRDTN